MARERPGEVEAWLNPTAWLGRLSLGRRPISPASGHPHRLSDCHNDDVKHMTMEMVVLVEEPMLLRVNIKVMVIVIRRAMMATVLMMKVLLMAPIPP